MSTSARTRLHEQLAELVSEATEKLLNCRRTTVRLGDFVESAVRRSPSASDCIKLGDPANEPTAVQAIFAAVQAVRPLLNDPAKDAEWIAAQMREALIQINTIDRLCRELASLPSEPNPTECCGHGRGGSGQCCDRAGEYNGFGSDGPTSFTCPKSCSCHD